MVQLNWRGTGFKSYYEGREGWIKYIYDVFSLGFPESRIRDKEL